MPINPDNDPNEAYELWPAGWREGWLTATCNGIPVHHFSPNAKDSRSILQGSRVPSDALR